MREVRLRDLGRWYSGGTPPREREEYWTGDIPWLSAKDIDGTSLREPTTFITREAALEYSRVLPARALLLIVRGMALAHGVSVVSVTCEIAFNQDLRGLVCNPGIHSRFVFHALIGARYRLNAHIDHAAHGTARLTDSVLHERVPVPDISVQTIIAAALDHESARLMQLRREMEGLARRIDEYRDALITEAVSGKLDVMKLSEQQLDESAHAAIEGDRPEVLSA